MDGGDEAELIPSQQMIMEVVRRRAGQFNRSGLAKLLVGSHSSRLKALAADPDYGRLATYGRKSLTTDIDILIDQGYLVQDAQGRLTIRQGGEEGSSGE